VKSNPRNINVCELLSNDFQFFLQLCMYMMQIRSLFCPRGSIVVVHLKREYDFKSARRDRTNKQTNDLIIGCVCLPCSFVEYPPSSSCSDVPNRTPFGAFGRFEHVVFPYIEIAFHNSLPNLRTWSSTCEHSHAIEHTWFLKPQVSNVKRHPLSLSPVAHPLFLIALAPPRPYKKENQNLYLSGGRSIFERHATTKVLTAIGRYRIVLLAIVQTMIPSLTALIAHHRARH
jgi:hypothetical protein